MKKKEWNEGLNHIDPDLVEKYVEQKDRLRQKNKKPKSVWLRFGAIAACFLLIVSAVIVVPMLREDDPGIITPPDGTSNDIGVNSGPGTTDNNNPNTSITDDPNETTEQIDSGERFLVTEDGRYVFCAYQNESLSDRKDTYKYKDYQELNLVSSQSSHSYVDETKDKDRKYRFGEDEVTIEYVKSFVSPKENSPLISKYNNYDVYKDSSGKMYHILADNDQLIKYVDNTDIGQGTITDIGQDRAVKIANAFLIEHLGVEVFNTYAINEKISVMFDKYWISYMKYVYGYATTDEIVVCVNVDGSVSSYTGLYVSLYDEISNDVNLETIQDAEDQLLEALYSAQLNNLTVVSKKIEIDENGELCIALYVTHGKNDQYADVFYLQLAQNN